MSRSSYYCYALLGSHSYVQTATQVTIHAINEVYEVAPHYLLWIYRYEMDQSITVKVFLGAIKPGNNVMPLSKTAPSAI